MADAGTGEPVSPTALEQQFTMFKTFQAMGLNPKGDTPEDFDEWIKSYVHRSKEVDVKPPRAMQHSLTLPTTDTGAIPRSGKVTTSVTTTSHPPKIRTFSGGDNKGETPYDIWRYEVEMIRKDPSYTVAQKDFAIRRSLAGSAARTIMYQGLEQSIEEILVTLDSVYGSVDNKEQLLAEFYSARQKEDEDVTTWSNRLQEIIGRGLEKKVIKHQEVNTMLHNMLYTGLRQDLKDISGHKFDTITDYNSLRVELRRIEKDHLPRKTNKPHPAKAVTSVEKTDFEELKGMVQQLTHTVAELKNRPPYQPQSYQYRPRFNNRGRGMRGYQQPRLPMNSPGQRPFLPPSIQRWQAPIWQQQQMNQPPSQDQQQAEETPIVCNRCGQEGHIQRGCRVRLDHSRRDLNSRKPGQRGRF